MKKIFLVILIFLSSCVQPTILKVNPPQDLITHVTTGLNQDIKDVKIVDSYQFSLSNLEKEIGYSSKWCIAISYLYLEESNNTWVPSGYVGIYKYGGNKWNFVNNALFKLDENNNVLSSFPWDGIPLSCEYFINKYSQDK